MTQLFERLQEEKTEIELHSKFNIPAWEPDSIQGLLNIDKETFNYLIERTGKEASRRSLKKAFNTSFIYEDDELTFVTSIGLYLFLNYSSDLKKFKHFEKIAAYCKKEAIHDLLRFFGAKATVPKKKTIFQKSLGLNLLKIWLS